MSNGLSLWMLNYIKIIWYSKNYSHLLNENFYPYHHLSSNNIIKINGHITNIFKIKILKSYIKFYFKIFKTTIISHSIMIYVK